jgi:hypothetical protein
MEKYTFNIHAGFMRGSGYRDFLKKNPEFCHINESVPVIQLSAEIGVDFTTCEISTTSIWVVGVKAKGIASLKNICRLENAILQKSGWEVFLSDINLIEND